MNTRNIAPLALTALALALSACGTINTEIAHEHVAAGDKVAALQAKQDKPTPIVTRTTTAWLMGSTVPVAPAPSPLLTRRITYNPRQSVTLIDIATFLIQNTGMPVDTTEITTPSTVPNLQQPGAVGTAPAAPIVPALTGTVNLSPVNQAARASEGRPSTAATQAFAVDYDGQVSGLLDIAAGKVGAWWKLSSDGRGVVFFKTETKTFYLPALPKKVRGSSAIAAQSTTSNGGGSSTAGGANNSNQIGASTTSEYTDDVWGDLEKTAQTVAAGAIVSVASSLDSVTVTGTPSQVRNVEEWIKGVSDNLSQQIGITVDVYTVKGNAEDNYSWDPTVVFSALSAKYGFKLTAPDAPAVLSGMSPMNLTASVLSSATGRAAQWSGSDFAMNALSTNGQVVQTMHQTVITLNGRPAPLQIANVQGYLAAETPSASVAVGATPLPPTLTPGSLTTGFTANFTPRLVNGKVLLAIDITNSNNNGFGVAGTSTSFIQTPNYDLGTFQQSASLTPGQSLLLTGVSKYDGQSKRSGVGLPENHLLGGGLDDSSAKQMTAIVVTAKVL
jgi:type IVB pilus formation R64 PilN family outer membrane protein